MQAPVTAEEARVRRSRLQQRVIDDAATRLAVSTSTTLATTFALLPLHRLKYMAQCVPEYRLSRKPIEFSGSFGALRHIWKNEGVVKYWRGLSPAMIYATPVVFGSQLATLNFAQDLENSPSVTGSFLRGVAVSAITASLATMMNIMDMAHIKMSTDLRYPEQFTMDNSTNPNSTQPQSLHNNNSNNTSSLKDGKAKKLVTYSPYNYRNWLYTTKRAYTINGARAFSYAVSPIFAMHFAHFSALFATTSFASLAHLDQSMPLVSTLLTSALTTLIVHPFDTIRTRMLYRLPTDSNYKIKPYSGMLNCAKYIWDHEGLKGYMRGSGAAVSIFFSTVICNAVVMSIVNSVKRDKMQREYLYKMHQFAQQERNEALATSRSEIERISANEQQFLQ